MVDAVRGRAFDDVPEAIRQDASERVGGVDGGSRALCCPMTALAEIHIDVCLVGAQVCSHRGRVSDRSTIRESRQTQSIEMEVAQ